MNGEMGAAFNRYFEAQRRLRRRVSIAYLVLFCLAAASMTALGSPWFGLAYAFMAGVVLGEMTCGQREPQARLSGSDRSGGVS